LKLRPNAKVTSFFASLIIRLLGFTWRIEFQGIDNLEKARKISNRIVFAFWHGRLLVLSWTHRNRQIHVLASDHYDGDLMGKTIEWLGFGHLKGSTSRGGAKALRDLKRVLDNGFDIGLTVDGPKGPRGRVQQGATELSRLSSSAVVPISNSASPRWIFRSWDRFQVPVPFARVLVEYGEPLSVPADAGADEREGLREELESRLDKLTARLDREIGYSAGDVWPHEDS
jgi:lysophospholipid acyltransferase (LPLAT)-like uncharacterized protein